MRNYIEQELLLRNGQIHIMDNERTTTESLLFRGSQVSTVGKTAQVEAAATDPTIIDLDGRTVLPGFNDAHTHIFRIGIELVETDLSDADTKNEALDMLAANVKETQPGEWVLGFRYDESTWPKDEQTYLSREELDAISTEHPIAGFLDGDYLDRDMVCL